MTEEERRFMEDRRGGTDEADRSDLFKATGYAGSRKRWGKHGRTKTVRAYEDVVDRFRAHVPDERDRADAASKALTSYLDAEGAPPTPERQRVTVNSVLTHRWYDEIDGGRKTVEYREINDYWTSRLFRPDGSPVDAIRFSRGYTNTRMTWEVEYITRDVPEGVYEIHLGKRISQ